MLENGGHFSIVKGFKKNIVSINESAILVPNFLYIIISVISSKIIPIIWFIILISFKLNKFNKGRNIGM